LSETSLKISEVGRGKAELLLSMGRLINTAYDNKAGIQQQISVLKLTQNTQLFS
jgi:hypothetical protein